MSHPSQPTLVGRTLHDKYRIDHVVGEGGFGVVYAGRHLTLDVPVAIKVLLPDRAKSAEQRAMLMARFSAEAQILARLRHPNIVAVLDFGFVDDPSTGPVPWLVLEWCDGETLDANLRRRRSVGPRPPLRSIEEAWSLMRPIVDAIAYGHSLGVVHRDLKPSNVMLVPSRHGVSPRVVDFGIAKRIEENSTSGTGETLTTTGTALFTPGYAAPEQVAMARTGPWTDVHALALMFTELLTDQRPYPKQADFVAVVDPARPTPARFGRDVGPIEAVLAKAVSLRPGERYADAEELLAALDEALGTSGSRLPQPPAAASIRPATGAQNAQSAPPPVPDETWRTSQRTLQASTSETSAKAARAGRNWLALSALFAIAIAASAALLVFASRSGLSADPEPAETRAGDLIATSPVPEPPIGTNTSAATEPSAPAPSASSTSTATSAPVRPRLTRPRPTKPPPEPSAKPVTTGRPPPALY